MDFRTIRGCRRTADEQRYIWAALRIFQRLPLKRREALRALIGEVAATPVEGRALYDVLVRGCTPTGVNARTGVTLARLYDMRREFYERAEL